MKRAASAAEVSVELFAATHVGRVRGNNEDSFLVADLTAGRCGLVEEVQNHQVGKRGSLLLVSDGMGGAQAGEVASRMAVELLFEDLVRARSDKTPDKLLIDAIERANSEIYRAAQADRRLSGMGTTLTAAIIRNGKVYIAEVGDSRAYVLRFGSLTQLTKDQSMVQRLLDSGVISAEEAARHPFRNVILQSLGSQPSVTVVMNELELKRDDILMLCSDGLTNKVPDQEIKEIILGSLSVDSACRNLVEAANRHGGDDNITVVMARFTGELPLPYEELETTDSTIISAAAKERLSKKITGQIRLRGQRTQEIQRRTQQVSVPAYTPTFTSIETQRASYVKVLIIISLIVLILILIVKIF